MLTVANKQCGWMGFKKINRFIIVISFCLSFISQLLLYASYKESQQCKITWATATEICRCNRCFLRLSLNTAITRKYFSCFNTSRKRKQIISKTLLLFKWMKEKVNEVTIVRVNSPTRKYANFMQICFVMRKCCPQKAPVWNLTYNCWQCFVLIQKYWEQERRKITEN
jgi:hypothetical protein